MKKHNQKGISLLLTLLIMAAIISIAISISRLTVGEIKISRESPQSLIAYYAAESGIEWALYQERVLQLTLTTEPDCGVHYLDEAHEICFRITNAIGVTPARTIDVEGYYKNLIRSIEITY